MIFHHRYFLYPISEIFDNFHILSKNLRYRSWYDQKWSKITYFFENMKTYEYITCSIPLSTVIPTILHVPTESATSRTPLSGFILSGRASSLDTGQAVPRVGAGDHLPPSEWPRVARLLIGAACTEISMSCGFIWKLSNILDVGYKKYRWWKMMIKN